MKQSGMKRALTGALAVVIVFGVYRVGKAIAAGIPASNALTYTGVLLDSNNQPVTASHNLQINLWDVASGGTAATDQLCTTSAPGTTPDGSGHFSIALDSSCVTAVKNHQDVWVEVVLDGAPLARTKMGAVPYAVEADHAQTASKAAVAVGDGGITFTVGAQYCGVTASSYDGAGVGGYQGAKQKCETACGTSTAHMCTGEELQHSLATLSTGAGAPTANILEPKLMGGGSFWYSAPISWVQMNGSNIVGIGDCGTWANNSGGTTSNSYNGTSLFVNSTAWGYQYGFSYATCNSVQKIVCCD